MKNLISLAALAIATLSIPTIAAAQDAMPTAMAAPTVADAEAFLAKAEKDLFDFSVEGAKVAWINATYITDDTDALAARYGEIGTEKAVQYALEAAKFQNVAGLSAETRRKLDILRGGLVLPAPTTDGAAKELSEIATKLNSAYGKGRGSGFGSGKSWLMPKALSINKANNQGSSKSERQQNQRSDGTDHQKISVAEWFGEFPEQAKHCKDQARQQNGERNSNFPLPASP